MTTSQRRISRNKQAQERDRLLEKGLKKCGCCQKIKPLTEFAKNARTISYHTSGCKTCQNARSKKYYHATKREKKLIYGENRTQSFHSKRTAEVKKRRQYDRDVLEIAAHTAYGTLSEQEAYDIAAGVY